MTRGNSQLRKKLWERCPYCFWCGCEVIYKECNVGTVDKSTATLDHIRSRHIPNRSEKQERWQKGIIVLSCWRCNNLREKYETQFIRELDQEFFYEKGNSKPSGFDFHKLHGEIASAIEACMTPEIEELLKETKRGSRLFQKISKMKKQRESARKANSQ